uniref:Uncharacterized protein n=1 Tax=uncultured prokaryote TaxID=198431 RepID=A0A0H5PYD8_9ZZZZ|nr:hypothetical protein [uncultured prokaryote]
MALVIPPGYGSAQFVFNGPVGTQPFVTTIGLDLAAAGGDYVEVANNVKTWYAEAFQTVTTNALVLDHVTLRVGQDGPGGSVDSDSPPIVMQSTATFAPIAMAVILRKVTNDLGRRGRGRMFLPGTCNEAGIDADGTLNSSLRQDMIDASATFLSALFTPSFGPPTPPVVLHSDGSTPSVLTNAAVSDTVGWIRGRIR